MGTVTELVVVHVLSRQHRLDDGDFPFFQRIARPSCHDVRPYANWRSSLSFRFSQSGITRSSRSKKAPPW